MKYLSLVFVVLFASCGLEVTTHNKGAKGDTGNVGNTGATGNDGVNGTCGGISSRIATLSECGTGGKVVIAWNDVDCNSVYNSTIDRSYNEVVVCNGVDGSNGLNGLDGTNGINGTNGTNGTNGADGQDGQDGEDAVSPFMPVGLVNPCGDAPSIHDEVFILLSNGVLVASFSDNASGNNTRLSILVPGTYITSDGDSCTFTVNSSGVIVNESHQY